jgi:chromatin remodeling complex protein RSC6
MDEIELVPDNILVEQNNVEEVHQSIFNQFDSILSKFSTLKMQITSIQHEVRSLEKNVKKDLKNLKKVADVKKKNKGSKKPSGFAAPSKVSNELCAFLNKDAGTDVARTEVTKAIIDYIETNKLTLKENKKTIIVPDEKLKTLLGVDETSDKPLTYFTLQKFMNKHFIKQTAIEA